MKPINVVNPYQNLTISNGKPLETSNISDIWDAISYALKDENDKISDEIVKKLAENHNFKEWMNLLPKSTPSIFEWYKNDFSRNNPNTYQKLNDVDLEIKKSGICLPIGQQLFRGGIGWIEDNNTAITTNPISTSFSPKIALWFARQPKNWCGNRINLFLLTIKEDGIKAFPIV